MGFEDGELDGEEQEAGDPGDEAAERHHPADVAKVQFRQISVSDAVSCGITLIGSDLRCWGSVATRSQMVQAQQADRGGKMKYVRHLHSSRHDTSIPAFVRGPFRQVSVGGAGVCAITASKRAEEEDAAFQDVATMSIGDPSTERRAGDELQCWGGARRKVNATAFDAWDQVSVGAVSICGVSMDSDLICFGAKSIMPSEVQDYHKYIIVA